MFYAGPCITSVLFKNGQVLETGGGNLVVVKGSGFGKGDPDELIVKVGKSLPTCPQFEKRSTDDYIFGPHLGKR